MAESPVIPSEIDLGTARFHPYMAAPGEPHDREIVCLEPSALALRLKGQRHLTLLESVMRSEHLGRYSFLACNPKATIEVTARAPSSTACRRRGALTLIDRLVAGNRQRHVPGLPPFQGGLAGYISYDFGRRLEPHARIPDFAPICPDLILHHIDCVAAFDHMQERAWIISETPERADEMEELFARSRSPWAFTPSRAGSRTSRARPMRRPSPARWTTSWRATSSRPTSPRCSRPRSRGLRSARLLPRAAPQEPRHLRRLHGLWRRADRLVLAGAPAAP